MQKDKDQYIILTANETRDGRADLSMNYVYMVKPLAMPFIITDSSGEFDEYAKNAMGLVLTGGDDINPARFGQKRHPKAKLVPPLRDETDFGFFHAFRKLGKPILGICRGMQVINVALGGDLVQHIPEKYFTVEHAAKKCDAMHKIRPLGDSFLGISEPTEVNSAHHQAVGKLGEGLRAVAESEDGVVEALQNEDGSIVAVQWHPERIDTELSQRIISYFANRIL